MMGAQATVELSHSCLFFQKLAATKTVDRRQTTDTTVLPMIYTIGSETLVEAGTDTIRILPQRQTKQSFWADKHFKMTDSQS